MISIYILRNTFTLEQIRSTFSPVTMKYFKKAPRSISVPSNFFSRLWYGARFLLLKKFQLRTFLSLLSISFISNNILQYFGFYCSVINDFPINF